MPTIWRRSRRWTIPSFNRIFDHHGLPAIKWMLRDLVKGQQLGGAALR